MANPTLPPFSTSPCTNPVSTTFLPVARSMTPLSAFSTSSLVAGMARLRLSQDSLYNAHVLRTKESLGRFQKAGVDALDHAVRRRQRQSWALGPFAALRRFGR